MSLNVTKEVATLKQMTVGQLRERYLQVTGEATQAANRKWLVRRIIWRMQSIEEGGLSEHAIARARELASGADLRTTLPKQRSLPADADLWQALPPKEQVRLVRLLIERVNFDGPGGNVAITFHSTGLKSLTENQLEHTQ